MGKHKKILIAGGILTVAALMCVIRFCNQQQKSVHPEDRILMAGHQLYYGTPDIGPMGDAGAVAGTITSSVGNGEVPEQNGQSNFGAVGNSYTKDYGDGFIMVFIEGEWYCFFTEEAEKQL